MSEILSRDEFFDWITEYEAGGECGPDAEAKYIATIEALAKALNSWDWGVDRKLISELSKKGWLEE